MRLRFAALLTAAAAAVLSPACGGGEDGSAVSGPVRVLAGPGAEAFAREAADRFEEQNSGAEVTVTSLRAAAGPKRLERLWVASDGTAVVANPNLDISCLGIAQLRALRARGPVIGRLAALGRDAETGRPLPAVAVRFYVPRDDPAATGEALADNEHSLGILPLHEFLDDHHGLDLVSVDAGGSCVPGTVETVGDGTYPLSRRLYLYLPRDRNAASAAFRRYVADNDDELADSQNLVPAPAGAGL